MSDFKSHERTPVMSDEMRALIEKCAIPMLELRKFMIDNLGECRNTHEVTFKWLEDHNLPQDVYMPIVRKLGGCCCDCEVAFNFPESVEEMVEKVRCSHFRSLEDLKQFKDSLWRVQ